MTAVAEAGIAPADFRGLMKRGEEVRASGDRGAALELFRAALALEPRAAWARMAAAGTLRDLGRADEADEACRALLADEPGNTGALMALGHSLRRRGDPAGALPLFQAALALKPREAWARMAVADTLAELDRMDEAEEACRALLADEPDNVGALMSLGRAANARADRKAAAAWFERAARADPDAPAPRLAVADALRDLGDFDAASEAAKALLARAPEHAEGWMSLGHTERRAGRREGALRAFARAAELKPGSPAPLVQMAVEERRLGRPENCGPLLERALELDGGDAEALQQLGEHHRLSGDLERALEAFRRAMAMPRRPSPWAFLAAAQALVDLGEAGAALRTLYEGEARLGPKPEFAAKRAELLRRTGDWHAALDAAERAARTWPNHFGIWFERASLERTRGGPEGFAAFLRDAPAGNTHDRARVHLLRGLATSDGWRFDEAQEHHARSIELNPDDGWPRVCLAQARLLALDVEGAREQLREVARLDLSAAKLQGRPANVSQTHLGQLLDEFTLDGQALAELRALGGLPPEDRIEPLLALVRRYPEYTPAAIGLLIALRQSGRLARRPPDVSPHAGAAPSIPRAFAQYWDDADVPADLGGIMRSWAGLYPRFALRRFNDAQARSFLARFHTAEVQAAYRRSRQPAQRADIFRLAYLYSQGGHYADADDRLVGDFEALRFPGARLVLYQEDFGTIGNNFIGAAPGHPLIGRALRLAVEAVNRGDNDILWLSTGPGLLTRAFAEMLADPGREPLAALDDAVVLQHWELQRTVSIHCLAGYKNTERHWSRTAFGQRLRAAGPGTPAGDPSTGARAQAAAERGGHESRIDPAPIDTTRPSNAATSADASADSRCTMSTATKIDVPIQQALQEIDDEVLAVIRRGLERRTTSFSSFGSIVTGNAYQSVNLRDRVQAGFRRSDPHLFDGIPLEGKRFVDLGCNYGEKTRLAALAGAEYAEGVEYEEYFVRMGGLLSVYNRVPNAVIRQGDITQPGCVRTEFDIGACFSAFVYMRRNLDELLSKIRSMFILETHAMEANWFEEYIRPVLSAFPYWVLYGFSDHGRGLETQRRAQIAFARDKASTGLVAIKRAEKLGAGHPDVHSLDLEQSRRAGMLMGNARRSKQLFQDLRASISRLAREDGSGLAELLRGALPTMDELREAYGQTDTRFGTDRYWRVLFEGVVHHLEHRCMTPENPYLALMRELAASGQYDAGMKFELDAEDRAIARLGPRLERMIETLLTKRLPEPLVVFNPISVPALVHEGYDPQDRQLNEHIHIKDRGEYRIQYIDGNHRLAAMWLSGANVCPVLPVWTNIFGFSPSDFSLFPEADRQDRLITPLLSKSVLGF